MTAITRSRLSGTRFLYVNELELVADDNGTFTILSGSIDLSNHDLADAGKAFLSIRSGLLPSEQIRLGQAAPTLPIPETVTTIPRGVRFRARVEIEKQNASTSDALWAYSKRYTMVSGVTLEEAGSLLPVLPSDELDSEVWRIAMENSGPVLEVTRALHDWKAYVRSAEFRGLVAPAAAGEVFHMVALDDSGSIPWAAAWMAIGDEAAGRSLDDSATLADKAEWVRDARAGIATRGDLASNFLAARS